MNDLEVPLETRDGVQDAVEAFYDQHPYPPPVADLDAYRQRWQNEGRRRADFHLHWPQKAYREDLNILVAGCGTSQAAKYALRLPTTQVVGIDVSAASIRHTEELKREYHLTNLQLFQLPVEQARALGRGFDRVVCTGVLHHLPDPQAGLSALREVLKPDGVIDLMVYAPYGRAGVYLLQEYCRLLGIGHSDQEITQLANTLTVLPPTHALARLLGESPDFRTKAGLADALLNPQDRAYTVPQFFDLIESCGMTFGRWVRQAPYLPQCGSLAATPHASRLAALPLREQYVAMELFRGNMTRHNAILYRKDGSLEETLPSFNGDAWLEFVPLRLPDTMRLQKKLPPGAAAVLINPAHSDPDITLLVDDSELRLVEAIDGKRTIDEIIRMVSIPSAGNLWQYRQLAHSLFQRLWWYDQAVFDTARRGGNVGS